MATLEQILNRTYQGTSAKFCFNPHEDYDRKTFVPKMGDLTDLEEYYEALSKNQGDMGAHNDLAKVLLANLPENMENERRAELEQAIKSDPNCALQLAYTYLNDGYTSLARYAATNRDEMLDTLSDKKLLELLGSMPLGKTGNKNYDKIKSLSDKIRIMQQLNQAGRSDLEAITPKEIQAAIMGYSPNMQEFIMKYQDKTMPIVAQSVADRIKKEYQSLFIKKDGSFDRTGLIKYIKANYEAVEDLISNEKRSDSEKYDLWDKNLKPQYMALGKVLYKPEKVEFKRDKDEDKEDRKLEVQEFAWAA